MAQDGRDGFYAGPVAAAIVAKLRAAGGVMELADLRDFEAEWVEPVPTTYRGFEVLQAPPNGQGFAVLELLNVLEPFDLAALGPRSARFWHLLIEAKKLAFADLERHNGDPRFTAVPLDRLLSKEHGARAGRADRPGAGGTVRPWSRARGRDHLHRDGGPLGHDGSAHYERLRDVRLVGLTVPGYGFVLHNRGAQFSPDPASANAVAPRKRPFHTIIPAFVRRGGKPWLAFGSMGGSTQAYRRGWRGATGSAPVRWRSAEPGRPGCLGRVSPWRRSEVKTERVRSRGDEVELLELPQHPGLGQRHLLVGGVARVGKVDRDVVLESSTGGEDEDPGG